MSNAREHDEHMSAPLPVVTQAMYRDKDSPERRSTSQEEFTTGDDRDVYSTGRDTPTQANWSTNEHTGPAYHYREQSNHASALNTVPSMRHAGPSTGHDTTPTMSSTNGIHDPPRGTSTYNSQRQSFESVAFPEPHPRRQPSTRSSLQPSSSSVNRSLVELSPSWNDQSQPPSAWVERKLQIHQSHRADLYDDESVFNPESQYEDEEEWDEEEDVEVDESRFFNRALLSEMAVQVKDKVVMGRHTKAGIAWVGSFTGRDVVVSHCSIALELSVRRAYKVFCHHTPVTLQRIDGMLCLALIHYKINCGSSKSIGTSNHFAIRLRMYSVSWGRWKAWAVETL